MEFLKGALIAGLWGCAISILLTLVIVLTVVLVVGVWDGGAFVRGMILVPTMIGVWVVPVSVVLGLVYVIIRRAVRVERIQWPAAGC